MPDVQNPAPSRPTTGSTATPPAPLAPPHNPHAGGPIQLSGKPQSLSSIIAPNPGSKPAIEPPANLPGSISASALPSYMTAKPAAASPAPTPTAPVTPAPSAPAPVAMTPSIPKPPISIPPPATTVPAPTTSTPAPKPVSPPPPAAAPTPPPAAPSPKPAPAPSAPPAPATNGPSSFSSSIRTMGSDVNALKAGQAPVGIALEKKSDSFATATGGSAPSPSAPAATPVAPAAPKPAAPSLTIPPAPSSAVAPAPAPRTPSAPTPTPPPAVRPAPFAPAPPPAPAFTRPPVAPAQAPSPIAPPPPSSGGSNTKIYAIVAVIVLIFGGLIAWLLIFKAPAQVAVSPTPIITQTPTSTPVLPPLVRAFGTAKPITIASSDTNALKTLQAALAAEVVDPNAVRSYALVDETGKVYGFGDFLTKVLKLPLGASDITTLDSQTWTLGLYGQLNPPPLGTAGSDLGDNLAKQTITNKVFLVAQVSDPNAVSALLQGWETTYLVKDFGAILGYTMPKTFPAFTPDYYNGLPIRYRELPDSTKGLGYATIDNLLLIGSSRDTFRAAADALKK